MSYKIKAKKFSESILNKITGPADLTCDMALHIYSEAGNIISNNRHRNNNCEYYRGILDVWVVAQCTLVNAYQHPEEFSDADAVILKSWDRIILTLEELVGQKPLRVNERKRTRDTERWKDLYLLGDDKMKKDVIKTALHDYPDFDLNIFNTSNAQNI